MLNFKIKGSCEIRITDSRSGEVKQVIEKENLITNGALFNILNWSPRGVFDFYSVPVGNSSQSYSCNIFISANTATPNVNATGVTTMAVAYTPSGVTKKTFYNNVNPIYGQLQQRIDFTGAERTFQTVGLQLITLGQFAGIVAYLLLDTPCTQGAFDYLDLFYRVQFINAGGQGLATDDALSDFARGCFDLARFDMASYTSWIGVKPPSGSLYRRYAGALAVFGGLGATVEGSHYKFKMTHSFSQFQAVGYIFGCMTQGSASAGGYHTLKNVVNPNAPFQNIFTHSANATVPFFDSLTTAGGNGKIRTSGTWTGRFPELYKITMVTGGAVGTATYKYSVRKHLGFNGNSYSDLAFNSPYRIDLPGFHGQKEENNDLLRWSNTQIVQYDQTGVMLLDVVDGNYKIWDSSTTPALTATRTMQCAVDPANQKIYVGCRTTGLWVIDVALNAIAHPFTNGCYGVDVGRNNVAYALIDGGLYRSSDWSTPLSFTYAGVTDSNWSKVLFLKADPEHASDRLCFVVDVGSGNRKIVWHQLTSAPTATLSYSSYGDANGVFYFLGSDLGASNWVNPHTAGKITIVASSVASGSVALLVDRATNSFVTNNTANSWVSFDLGANRSLVVDKYIFRTDNAQGYAIRNWKIQGSNNVVSNSIADINAATWIDIDTRTNDTTQGVGGNVWAAYTVPSTPASYRWIRILQTGGNSNTTTDNRLIFGEVEFYGTFSAPSFPNTLTGATSSSIKSYPASLDVSDTGSFWACGAGRLTFGNTSLNGLGGQLLSSYRTDPTYGTDYYFKIAFYNQYLILFDRIVDISGAAINYFSSLSGNQNSYGVGCSSLLHLDSGICILSTFLRQMFSDNSYCWKNFGWDGSQWALNHSGAKTTHADNQLLGNGINIRFENGANAPHFIGTDFFTQSICFGKHKDNSSVIQHNSAWYSCAAVFDKQVQNGAVVPAVAPFTLQLSAATETDYRRVETDSKELHKFYLNGTLVTTVYCDNNDVYTAPGINEVFVRSDGKVFFNPADATKTFSGTYAYLKY